MTEDELRIIERRMAINRGEVPGVTPEMRATMDGNMRAYIAEADARAESFEWPEHMIEAECTKLLEADDWRALRTDPVSDRGRGKGFGEIGMADHLYIRYDFVRQNAALGRLESMGLDDIRESSAATHAYCDVFWIEFKSAKGKPSKEQTAWHTRERARGALTWIAGVDFPASVEGFVAHYRASGLDRGRI